MDLYDENDLRSFERSELERNCLFRALSCAVTGWEIDYTWVIGQIINQMNSSSDILINSQMARNKVRV